MGIKNLVLIFIVVFLSVWMYGANAQLADSNSIVWGSNVFQDYDGGWHYKSDYNSTLVDMGTYWTTQEPAGISGRFYDDGRVYLGQDLNHYVGMQPVGIYYINYQDPTQRTRLLDLTACTLSVNDNVATYEQGPVDIIFTNSFSQIKGDIIFPNAPPVPSVSNPALVMVWEIVEYAGINTDDGERSEWWFDNVKASFPIGDIQNNGSIDLKKKIFRQDGKIYLVEGVSYNWISNANRTDAHFIIDPSITFNNSDSWAGTSGTMIPHGDGNLRSPPNVTTGLVSWWEPATDVGSGATLTDIWGSNDGTINGATWNVSGGGLDYDGAGDYVDCGNDASLEHQNISLISSTKTINYLGSLNGGIGKGSFFNSPGVTEYVLDFHNGIARGRISNGTITENDTIFILDNNIHHWASIASSTQIYLYKDGVSSGSPTARTIGDIDYSGHEKFMIGARDGGAYSFTGTIGRTAIYSVPITNDQINETNANYHTASSYRQIDSAQDAGAGQVWRYINVSGTDASANTSLSLWVNGSNSDPTGGTEWIEANSSFNTGDNVSIGSAYQYQYAKFRITMNTTYQPETDIISAITITSGVPSISTPSFTITSPVTPYDSHNGTHVTFTGTVDQTGNFTWYFDGSIIQYNNSTTTASYLNTSPVLGGPYNVTLSFNNSNGAVQYTWAWTVEVDETMWDIVENSIDFAISSFGLMVGSMGTIIVTAFQLMAILLICILLGGVVTIVGSFFRW